MFISRLQPELQIFNSQLDPNLRLYKGHKGLFNLRIQFETDPLGTFGSNSIDSDNLFIYTRCFSSYLACP